MAIKLIQEDDFYVGDEVLVEVRLFDEATKKQATGRAILLAVTKPIGTVISSQMVEVGSSDPGLYQGSAVFDAEGEWKIEARVGNTSVFRHDHLYVGA